MMGKYINIYFSQMPENSYLDEIEDDLSDLLDERGEVTGAGFGVGGGNIDLEIYGEWDVVPEIKSYLVSCGFGEDTVLDIGGKREPL